ncbi:MAG: response regulator [Actinomycetota bacterium]
MDRIRVIVADDQALMVEALSTRLEVEPAIEVVGTASRSDELVREFVRLRPDVVVTDISMPGGGGLEALRGILRVDRHARVILFTAVDNPADIQLAQAAGAWKVVNKIRPTKDLVAAVLSAWEA